MCVASASFGLKIAKKMSEDGVKLQRVLSYIPCWLKGYGPGSYPQTLTGCNKVHKCPIAWLCLYLEHIGAIRSARAVYAGEEELLVDPTIFESHNNLIAKLERAQKTLNKTQLDALQNPEMQYVPKGLWDQLYKEDKKESPVDFCILLFVTVLPTTKQVSSDQMGTSTANMLISDGFCWYRDIRGKSIWIGVTGRRKIF
jgi:hypothetical protein